MAVLSQQPTQRDILGVAGSPFVLSITVTAKDQNGNTIPWGDFSGWSALATDPFGADLSAVTPTVTSPSSGIVQVSLTAAQATAIAAGPPVLWALLVTYGGGTYSLIAGTIAMAPSTQPGTSLAPSETLSVAVGQVAATLAIAIGGAGVVAAVSNPAGDTTLTFGGTPADITAKVTPGTFDASGSAAAAQAAAEAASDPVGSATAAQSAAEAFATAAVASETTRAQAAEALALEKANNLSDLADAPTARTHLGLGTAATHAATDFDAAGAAAAAQAAAEAASDPAGSASAAQAAAEAASDPAGSASAAQTAAESYADTNKLAKSANLSDVGNAATARTNLGLGNAATHASTDFDATGSATAAQTAAESYAAGLGVTAPFDNNYVYNVPNVANVAALAIKFISGRANGNTGFAVYDAAGSPILTIGATGGPVVYGDRSQAAVGVFGPYISLDGTTNPPSVLFPSTAYGAGGRIWGWNGPPSTGWVSGVTKVGDLWRDFTNNDLYQCTVSGAGTSAGTWTTAFGPGAQVAYSPVSANYTNQPTAASAWASAAATSGAAPSITLPNDGKTYRVAFFASYWKAGTSGDICAIGLGTSPTNIISAVQLSVNNIAAPLPPVTIDSIVGSGQTISVYTMNTSGNGASHVVFVGAGASGSATPSYLAAYRAK